MDYFEQLAKRVAARNAAARDSHRRIMGRIISAVVSSEWGVVDDLVKQWTDDNSQSQGSTAGPRDGGGQVEEPDGTQGNGLDSRQPEATG